MASRRGDDTVAGGEGPRVGRPSGRIAEKTHSASQPELLSWSAPRAAMGRVEGQYEVKADSTGHVYDISVSDEEANRPSGSGLTIAHRAQVPQAKQPRFASARVSQAQPAAGRLAAGGADHLQDTTLQRGGEDDDNATEP